MFKTTKTKKSDPEIPACHKVQAITRSRQVSLTAGIKDDCTRRYRISIF